MNHYEALGRFVELEEAVKAAGHRRQALLNNLGAAASRAASLPSTPFDLAAARAVLDGIAQAAEEIARLEPELHAAAAACGKRP